MSPAPTFTPTYTISEPTPRPLTSSSADTRASRSPSPASAGGAPTPATSGPSSLALLAYYDPDTSCWRTSQATFDLDSMPSSLTLPAWGMTRNGELFELPTLAHRTDAKDSSSLLPTPTGDDANNVTRESGDFQSLARTAHSLLPTPTARDFKGSGQNPSKHMREGRLTGIEHRDNPTGEFTKPQSVSGNDVSDTLPVQLMTGDA